MPPGPRLLRRLLLAPLLALTAACSPGPAPSQGPDRTASASPTAAAPMPPSPPSQPPGPSGPSTSPTSPVAAPPSGAQRVADLVAARPTSGRHTVIGYVAKIYFCPPCPPGAQCKPCMGDNVVFSDAPRRIEQYGEMGEGDVIVFGERAALEKLALGKRYRVDVDVRATRTTSQQVNDLALAGAEPSP